MRFFIVFSLISSVFGELRRCRPELSSERVLNYSFFTPEDCDLYDIDIFFEEEVKFSLDIDSTNCERRSPEALMTRFKIDLDKRHSDNYVFIEYQPAYRVFGIRMNEE
uniref:Secreted protein n=2 Tax=Bursaphelenchus xylophilus TaxID=6326 RepID=A0A1I7SFD0_BURXY